MISLSSHGLRSSSDPSRRSFLITMLGAGVMLGYAQSTLGAADVMLSALTPSLLRSADELFEPTIWYEIDPSGTVTINIIRAEMGQHVGTALARIVADELEADWSKVRIVTVDSAPKWGNHDYRWQLVGVAEFPGAQPGGRGRPHCSDRRRREAAWRSCSIVHGTRRRGARQEEDLSRMAILWRAAISDERSRPSSLKRCPSRRRTNAV